MEALRRSPLEWGYATLAVPGQSESGDVHVVRLFQGGALLGVIDGLGHGREAAEAARIAATTLESRAQDPVARLIELCHEKLKGTRGVAMSLVSFDSARSRITWLSVGNVT